MVKRDMSQNNIPYGRLQKMLFESFRRGYLRGAVAVAKGDVTVEKYSSGYYLRGDKNASTDTTTTRQ